MASSTNQSTLFTDPRAWRRQCEGPAPTPWGLADGREGSPSSWEDVRTGRPGLREPPWAKIQAGTYPGLRLKVPRPLPQPVTSPHSCSAPGSPHPSSQPSRQIPSHPPPPSLPAPPSSLKVHSIINVLPPIRSLSVLFFYPADFFCFPFFFSLSLYLLIPNEEKVY